MRNCYNDVPEVYEADNEDFAALMRTVADKVDELANEPSWINMTVVSTEDDGSPVYRATLYVH
jgi:hypothetical protein